MFDLQKFACFGNKVLSSSNSFSIRHKLISIGYKSHALEQYLYLLYDEENFLSIFGLDINNILGRN